jgi:hypothetical protein
LLYDVEEEEEGEEGEEGDRSGVEGEDLYGLWLVLLKVVFLGEVGRSLSVSREMWQNDENRNPQKDSIDMQKQNKRKLIHCS